MPVLLVELTGGWAFDKRFFRTSFLANPNVASFKLVFEPNLQRVYPKRFALFNAKAIITSRSHFSLKPMRATRKKSPQKTGAKTRPNQKIRPSLELCRCC